MKLSPLAVSCAVLLACTVRSHGQASWDGEVSSAWSTADNWLDDEVPADDDDIEFDGTADIFTVNVGATRLVGSVVFDSDTAYTLNNGALSLLADGNLSQDGEADVTINSGVVLRTGAHAFDGDGTAVLNVAGVISGPGPLNVAMAGTGRFNFTNAANTFTGGLTVTDGVLAATAPVNTALALPASAATSSYFGNVSGSALTINGGELRLVVSGTGAITPAASMEPIVFGEDGGTLNFAGALATTNALVLNTATATATDAIIRHAVTNGWARNSGVNIGTLTGSGNVRFELTNGAQATIFTTATINAAVTVAGVVGGNSGTSGDGATTVGKFSIEPSASGGTLTLTQPLVFEDAVQVAASSQNQTLQANLIISAGADVAIQGRGTGTGTGTPTDSQLTLASTVGGRTILVENTADLNIDSGFRSQTRNGPVLINAHTTLEGGATLRFRRTGAAAASVAPHTWAGNLTAQGSTANEAELELQLDLAATGGSAVNVLATHQLTINGIGRGGLRVSAGGVIATQTSLQRLTNYLTPARTAALAGSGGYLTIAPSNAAFVFTAAHQWIDPDVGLRVDDTVAGGADLSFDGASAVTFSRNLLVSAGALVDAQNDAFAGTVRGLGSLGGNASISAGGRLSPALDDGQIGTLAFTGGLSLTDGALFTFDLAASGSGDLVTIGGTLALAAQEFSDFSFAPQGGFGPGSYTLFDAATLTGSLGANVSGPVGGFTGTLQVSGDDVLLVVVPEPTHAALLACGALLLATRRRTR